MKIPVSIGLFSWPNSVPLHVVLWLVPWHLTKPTMYSSIAVELDSTIILESENLLLDLEGTLKH